jgi:CDP-diacylglycerol--glycerol-3-phosphate 3-phosphatidyltransferase
MNGRIWTISNLLSILRIILAIPIVAILQTNNPADRLLILILLIIAALTDLFDGMLARRLNQVTEFGKIIDPVADKIAIGAIAIVIALQGKLPFWFIVLVILRDIVIMAGGVYVKNKKNITLQSNIMGKWAVFVISLLIIFSIFDFYGILWLKTLLLAVGAIVLVLSFVFYLTRFIRVIREDKLEIHQT